MRETIAVIGAGRLGLRAALRLRECGYNVLPTRRSREGVEELRRLGFNVLGNREAVSRADAVIISVKPWQVEEVANEIKDVVAGKLLVSFAAGVPLERLRRLFPGAEVYRAMPTLLVEYGRSPIALVGSGPREALVERVLGCLGRVYKLQDERMLAAWTALVGCAPGILAALIDAMVLGGVAAGLPRSIAEPALLDVLEGLPALVRSVGSLQKVRDEVATPGGATIEAIRVLLRNGLSSITEAVVAAYEKVRRMEEERQ